MEFEIFKPKGLSFFVEICGVAYPLVCGGGCPASDELRGHSELVDTYLDACEAFRDMGKKFPQTPRLGDLGGPV